MNTVTAPVPSLSHILRDLRDHPAGSPKRAADTSAHLLHELRHIKFVRTDDVPVRPVVFATEAYSAYMSAARRFVELIERACWWRADSPIELLSVLQAPPDAHILLTNNPSEREWASCMSRTDAVVSGGELKFLECNIGGAIGGVVAMHLLTGVHRRLMNDGTGAPVRFESPFRARLGLYREACRRLSAPPRVALLGTMRDDSIQDMRYWKLECDYMGRRGVEAQFVEVEDAALHLHASRGPYFPIALRHFMPQLCVADGMDLSAVMTAQTAGQVMLAPETATLLENKQILAWLSEGQPWMTASDRVFLDRHLPWTRIVADRAVEFEGGTVRSLPKLLMDRQDAFVIKPVDQYGGRGVLVGRFAEASDWREAVEQALSGSRAIVQRYVEPDPLDMTFHRRSTGDTFTAPVSPVFGFLLMGGTPAGCVVRHAVRNTTGVVNALRGASINIAGHGTV
ncbi:hypothetical protein ACFWZA_01830 [[Kitasatospora] papulosa]|uniref:hypothetical protein n=1 Tax=Streptomyces TaxID=1883 RepID=UPI0036604E86